MNRVGHVKKLYKTILLLHRGLPEELRGLGNGYVRDEFKRHKTCNKSEADEFMKEWTDYAITLTEQLGKNRIPQTNVEYGKHLDPDLLNHMRDEQIAQLYELMKATTEIK